MKITYFLTLLFLICSCASMDLPPGGEKDIEPPQIIKSSPSSLETLVTYNTIKIEFDEYFTLNNLNNNLIVSPPLSKAPKTVIKGKTLILNLQEELLPDVTYQFYFGEGIKDLNEGNATKDLRLVFSTGTRIDTNSIGGIVINAFDQKPEKDIKVMLYKEFSDSQLIHSLPYYLTKTDDNGFYMFNNITSDSFQIYGLDDKNNNNTLDLEESFAFFDRSVSFKVDPGTLFLSTPTNQQPIKLISTKRRMDNQFILSFSKKFSLDNKIQVVSSNKVLNSKTNALPWHFGSTTDTIYVYNEVILKDSSSIMLINNNDTFTVQTNKFVQSKPFLSDYSIKKVKPNSAISLFTNYAVLKTNVKQFFIYDLKDSTPISISNLKLNANNELLIHTNLTEKHTYQLVLKPGAIMFVNGETNLLDTLTIKTFSKEETGDLEINFQFDTSFNSNNKIYLKILRNKELYTQIVCDSDTLIKLNYLVPGKYTVYAFEDIDKNLEWSPANYFKKQQPEPIWRIKSTIEVRKNWSNKNIQLNIK